MTWAKFDDRFPDHEKIAPLGNSAFRLHVTAICYVAAQLTDGLVSAGSLRRIGWACDNLAADVQELCAAGLWEIVDAGYVIHDYLDYNPSKAEVEAHKGQVSAERSKAGKAGMASRWHNKNNKAITNALQEAYQNDNPVPVPVPVVNKDSEKTKDDAVVAVDPAYGQALRAFENDISLLSGSLAEDMADTWDLLTANGTPDWWYKAIEVSVAANARSWRFMRGVLTKCLQEGHPPGYKRNNGHGPAPVADLADANEAAYTDDPQMIAWRQREKQ